MSRECMLRSDEAQIAAGLLGAEIMKSSVGVFEIR